MSQDLGDVTPYISHRVGRKGFSEEGALEQSLEKRGEEHARGRAREIARTKSPELGVCWMCLKKSS